jgi:hypothetical protein
MSPYEKGEVRLTTKMTLWRPRSVRVRGTRMPCVVCNQFNRRYFSFDGGKTYDRQAALAWDKAKGAAT